MNGKKPESQMHQADVQRANLPTVTGRQKLTRKDDSASYSGENLFSEWIFHVQVQYNIHNRTPLVQLLVQSECVRVSLCLSVCFVVHHGMRASLDCKPSLCLMKSCVVSVKPPSSVLRV